MIAIVKSLHIAGLSVWCAGLLILPLLLHLYGQREDLRTQAGFTEFRLLVHASYIKIVTPAALIAIASGTILIFLEGLTDAWLMAKLAVVAAMVLLHAWMGHLVVETAEGKGSYRMPEPLIALPLAIVLMTIVLVLVLAKPDLVPFFNNYLPDFLLAPQERPLPPILVPI
ncbi:MAG: CopD family protein [Pararhodobacter sp.]